LTADHSGCAGKGMNSFCSLERWDCRFESHSGHGCLCAFILCVGSGLASGWSPVQGVLPTVYRIKKLKQQLRSNKKDCRAIDDRQLLIEWRFKIEMLWFCQRCNLLGFYKSVPKFGHCSLNTTYIHNVIMHHKEEWHVLSLIYIFCDMLGGLNTEYLFELLWPCWFCGVKNSGLCVHSEEANILYRAKLKSTISIILGDVIIHLTKYSKFYLFYIVPFKF
jgi:hypothetical protein